MYIYIKNHLDKNWYCIYIYILYILYTNIYTDVENPIDRDFGSIGAACASISGII